MLTIRGHHLLCSLNYSGKGYTPAFITGFDNFCARVTAGELVRLTWAPDSICAPMIGHPTCHCHQWDKPVRDFLGFLMTSLVLRRWCFPPRTITLTPRDVDRLRAAFRLGLTRPGCLVCQWFDTCSQTAKAGNKTSKLHPPQP